METVGFSGKQDTIVSSGFDWLTVTEVEGEFAKKLYDAAIKIEAHVTAEGHKRKDWAAMGYQGFGTGALKYGERGTNEAIMILTGSLAEKMAFTPNIRASRVTRVDVQVTVRFDPPLALLASSIHKVLEKAYAGKRRKPFLSLLQDQTGDTLYIGKRNAEISLRFYDKSARMMEKNLGTCWRYEVQYRREAAKRAVRKIKAAPNPNLTAIGLVAAEFEKRKVSARFGAGRMVTAIEVGRTVTTEDGQIAWLEKCVAPVVAQLCFLGYEEQVINALSLRAIALGIKES